MTGKTIYINAQSKEDTELGTREFPYKSLQSPFLEVLHKLTSLADLEILVKEDTTNFVNSQIYTLSLASLTLKYEFV